MPRFRTSLPAVLTVAIVVMGAIAAVIALLTMQAYRDAALSSQGDYLRELVGLEVRDRLRAVGERLDVVAGQVLEDPQIRSALDSGATVDVGRRLSAYVEPPVTALQLLPAKHDLQEFVSSGEAGEFVTGPRCPNNPFGGATGDGLVPGPAELCSVGDRPFLVVRRDLVLSAATAQVRVFADPQPMFTESAESLGVQLRPVALWEEVDPVGAFEQAGLLVSRVTLRDRNGARVLDLLVSKPADEFRARLAETRRRVVLLVAIIVFSTILVALLLLKHLLVDPLRGLTSQLRSGTLPAHVDALARRETLGGVFSLSALGELYETLREMAIKEPLTGLYNRALFEDKLDQFIAEAHRAPRQAAVIMIDLDRFKSVNDNLGHRYGDLVLRKAARRLTALLRKSDVLSRFGGDEFTLLIPDSGPDHLTTVSGKIISAIEREMVIDGHRIALSASVGVALFPDHGQDVGTLLQRADSAMYAAKNSDIKVVVYEPEEGGRMISGLAIAHELRQAIKQNGLQLAFQPVIDPAGGDVDYFEALVRWGEPERAGFSTDELVRVAERNGLIRPMTDWLIDAACRQLASWGQEGIGLRVGINLSMQDLHDASLPEQVGRALREHRVDPSRLVIEITENGIMQDAEQVQEILAALADMGIALSIDDFGTGQASLAYLKKLPVQSLKIDRSFVTDMDSDEDDAAIVRATIDLSHDLGLRVTAEGVETQAIFELLRELGCDRMQGYFISPPLSPEEVTRWAAPARASAGHR